MGIVSFVALTGTVVDGLKIVSDFNQYDKIEDCFNLADNGDLTMSYVPKPDDQAPDYCSDPGYSLDDLNATREHLGEEIVGGLVLGLTAVYAGDAAIQGDHLVSRQANLNTTD